MLLKVIKRIRCTNLAIDTTNMLETQIVHLLQEALNEFGIHEVKIEVPRYIAMLNKTLVKTNIR